MLVFEEPLNPRSDHPHYLIISYALPYESVRPRVDLSPGSFFSLSFLGRGEDPSATELIVLISLSLEFISAGFLSSREVQQTVRDVRWTRTREICRCVLAKAEQDATAQIQGDGEV